jgi:hypothetical protein
MIHYAINHYVTSSDDPINSTVHGDDSLAVWVDSDPQTDTPDHTHEQPSEGWTWRTNQSGWQKHPNILKEYVSDASKIERLSPWDTTLTDGVQQ